MKKILKKLFIVALAIGVLSPYIEIPIVKAESCSRHLQSYLFLDSNILYSGIEDDSTPGTTDYKTLFEIYARNGGYQTTTEFPYEFAVDVEVDIKNVEPIEFDGNASARDSALDEYIDAHNGVLTWARVNQSSNNDYRTSPSLYGAVFVTNPYSGGYSSNTVLLHGKWTNYNSNGEALPNTWKPISTSATELTPFKSYVLQNSPALSGMDATFYKGESDRIGNLSATNTVLDKTSLAAIVNSDDKSKLGYWQAHDKYSLPISIKRKLSNENYVNSAIFGYVTENTLFIFGTSGGASGGTISSLTELDNNSSYAQYKEYIHDLGGTYGSNTPTADTGDYVVTFNNPGTASNPFTANNFSQNPKNFGVDFNIYASYQWPVILSVEYETCSNRNSGTPWELIYDGNYDNAKNIPAPVPNIPAGDSVKLAAAPKRDGYTFKKWCTDKEGKASCYNAETNFKNTTGASKVTLYAQWGDTNGADNKDTGVFSYVISFIAVGAIAGTIYYISKKKNLFKQI